MRALAAVATAMALVAAIGAIGAAAAAATAGPTILHLGGQGEWHFARSSQAGPNAPPPPPPSPPSPPSSPPLSAPISPASAPARDGTASNGGIISGGMSTLITVEMAADLLIGLAYIAIPCMIAFFQRQLVGATSPTYRGLLVLFQAFILCCGATHLLHAMRFSSDSILLVVTKVITAAVSCLTSAMLFWVVPVAFSMPARLHRLESELGEMIREANRRQYGMHDGARRPLRELTARLRYKQMVESQGLDSAGGICATTAAAGGSSSHTSTAPNTQDHHVDSEDEYKALPLERVCHLAVRAIAQSVPGFASVLMFMEPAHDSTAPVAAPAELTTGGGPGAGDEAALQPAWTGSGSGLRCIAEYHPSAPTSARLFADHVVDTNDRIYCSMTPGRASRFSSVDLACLIGCTRFVNAIAMQMNYGSRRGLLVLCATKEGPVMSSVNEILHYEDPLHYIQTALDLAHARDRTRRLRHELSTAISARAAAETARTAALEQVVATNDLLATTSHELRTPMNAIVGMVDVLLDESSNIPLCQEVRESLEIVLSSANLLGNLINNLLDLAKLHHQGAAGEGLVLAHAPFRLRTCIEACLDLVAPRLEHIDVALNYILDADVPEVIAGDRTRVTQILANLLGNAAKFTEQGEILVIVSTRPRRVVDPAVFTSVRKLDFRNPAQGVTPATLVAVSPDSIDRAGRPVESATPADWDRKASLSPGSSRRREATSASNTSAPDPLSPRLATQTRTRTNSLGGHNGYLYFYVVDTGCGIHQHDMGRLFERFQQGQQGAANRRQHGTGLGLAVSARLVELHGGQMAVQSAPGVGTVFSFSLRMQYPGAAQAGDHDDVVHSAAAAWEPLWQAPTVPPGSPWAGLELVVVPDPKLASSARSLGSLLDAIGCAYTCVATVAQAQRVARRLHAAHVEPIHVAFLIVERALIAPATAPGSAIDGGRGRRQELRAELLALQAIGPIALLTRRGRGDELTVDVGWFDYVLRKPVKRLSLERVLHRIADVHAQMRDAPVTAEEVAAPLPTVVPAQVAVTVPVDVRAPYTNSPAIAAAAAAAAAATFPGIQRHDSVMLHSVLDRPFVADFPNGGSPAAAAGTPPAIAPFPLPPLIEPMATPSSPAPSTPTSIVTSRTIATPEREDWMQQRVLVVDDNVINLKVAQKLLKSIGVTAITTANHGGEAVELVDRGAFDIVFMDVSMPVMDGLEATRRIRHAKSTQAAATVSPWICAMTASALPDEQTACQEAGMDDFVPKPVKRDAVIRALKNAHDHLQHRDRDSDAP
ncbi:hypothetical protein GGF31_007395 [Allomyces arbusculus]|nr:hypothetical protein GGF31_007395 [Allomyces arbusculus]